MQGDDIMKDVKYKWGDIIDISEAGSPVRRCICVSNKEKCSTIASFNHEYGYVFVDDWVDLETCVVKVVGNIYELKG